MPGFFEKSYKQFIPLCITHIYAYLMTYPHYPHCYTHFYPLKYVDLYVYKSLYIIRLHLSL